MVIAMPNMAIAVEPEKMPKMLGAKLKIHLCDKEITVTHPEYPATFFNSFVSK